MSKPTIIVPKCSEQADANPLRLAGVVVFSGGTGANHFVDVFSIASQGLRLSYILPISDNGGSTSEICRVFGGPGTIEPASMSSHSD